MANLPATKKVGRPTKMTADTLKKLEEAFAIGASDREACFYADISLQTLYTYQQHHPEFVERKEALKERPVLLARQTVVKGITSDPKLAMDFLKSKAKDEFGTRVEMTGRDGGPMQLETIVGIIREANERQPQPASPESTVHGA